MASRQQNDYQTFVLCEKMPGNFDLVLCLRPTSYREFWDRTNCVTIGILTTSRERRIEQNFVVFGKFVIFSSLSLHWSKKVTCWLQLLHKMNIFPKPIKNREIAFVPKRNVETQKQSITNTKRHIKT